MSIKIINGPNEMPVSLDEARTAARVNGTDTDSDIAIRVGALTTEAEHIIGQVIINRTYQIRLPSFPISIPAPAVPLSSISEIVYFDVDGAERTLATNTYLIDESSEPPSIVSAGGFEWPGTTARWDAVKVTVVCGHGATYASTPPAFKGFVLAKVKEYFAPSGTPESPFLVRGLDSLKVYG